MTEYTVWKIWFKTVDHVRWAEWVKSLDDELIGIKLLLEPESSGIMVDIRWTHYLGFEMGLSHPIWVKDFPHIDFVLKMIYTEVMNMNDKASRSNIYYE